MLRLLGIEHTALHSINGICGFEEVSCPPGGTESSVDMSKFYAWQLCLWPIVHSTMKLGRQLGPGHPNDPLKSNGPSLELSELGPLAFGVLQSGDLFCAQV